MKKTTGLGYIPTSKIIAHLAVTGHPTESYDKVLKLAIKLVKQYGTTFKVGKTGTDKRGMNKDYKKYNHMIYVYATTSEVNVSEMESKLNDYFITHYPELCDNDKKGSAKRTSEKSLNKRVYLVFM